MAHEDPGAGVLRGVQLEPTPESPFASAARGGSPPQPGSPNNSLSSSRAASAEPFALLAASAGAAQVVAPDGTAPTHAPDGDAATQPKKPKPPRDRTVSWNVALHTVREYEISETHSEPDVGRERCCATGCCVQ